MEAEQQHDSRCFLTRLEPVPECMYFITTTSVCDDVEEEEEEVLVLQGSNNNKYHVNLDSLSLLKESNKKNNEEYHYISVWNASSSSSMLDKSKDWMILRFQQIRGLRERCERLLQQHQQQHDRLDQFQQKCLCIFQYIQKAMQTRSATKQQQQHCDAAKVYSFSAKHARYLFEQLKALETKYGTTAIAGIADSCQKVTLQYQDAAQRNHSFTVTVQPTTAAESALLDYFPWLANNTHPLDKNHKKKRKHSDITATTTTTTTSLLAIYEQFMHYIQVFQDFYHELDLLDATGCCVGGALRHVTKFRTLHTADGQVIALSLNPFYPRQFPQFHYNNHSFKTTTETIMKQQQEYWKEDRSVKDNLEACLGIRLCPPATTSNTSLSLLQQDKTTQQIPAPTTTMEECGICLSRIEHGHDDDDDTDTMTTEWPKQQQQQQQNYIACDNSACGRTYHSKCLEEWFWHTPESRVSLDRLVGTCPYCKRQPIAVLMTRNM